MWTLPNIEVYESYNERSRKHNSGSYIIDLEEELVFPPVHSVSSYLGLLHFVWLCVLRPGGLCKSYGEGGETTTVVSQGMVHFGSVLCGSVVW